jgi:hypothetical protein
MKISYICKDWCVILEHNAEKKMLDIEDSPRVIPSIMHNANNENLCTLKNFHIFLNIQFK